MELDKLWTWQKKKLACRIRPENGNPSGDSLKDMLEELAGVDMDLNELLNEMKTAKKKKEMVNKVTMDYEGDKTFKDVLYRSRILGATKLALDKMEEYDKVKSTTLTQRNVKKVFTVIPKSPPKRVLMDLQRERSKPLRIPDQEEHKAATEKLEKKLAKQRAARMAAIEQSSNDDNPLGSSRFGNKKAIGVNVEAIVENLRKSQVFDDYEGDLFSSGGPYLEGMLYLSRMADSSLRTKRVNTSAEYESTKNTEGRNDLLNTSDSKSAVDKRTNNNNGANNMGLENQSDVRESDNTSDSTSANLDHSAKLSCAAALCNWSRNSANAQRLASEGAVRAIMQLSLEQNPEILMFCAAAFRFMSDSTVLATAMIEDGVITTLSDLISSNSHDDFICYNIAIALVNLTRINGKEGQIVEAAIVLALMNLIMIKPELSATCVRGLYNLTCVDIHYPSIERVIRALVSLSLSGAANIKHLCAAALCNLSDLKSVRARMVEEGAINVLTVLSRGAETRTRRICAVILQNLSAAKSIRVEMASRNSIAAAYSLSSDQDPIILRCIGLTISRLALEPTNCQRIIHEGGIVALCNIAVKYPTIPGITQPVASAFQLLSSNQPFRVNIVNEGSVTAIATLLRSSVDLFTLQHSLLALCNLLCEIENHLPIIQQGLIMTLITMCGHENDLLKDFCSLAFLNFSFHEESRKHLVNSGAVTAIITIAKQISSYTTKKRCAATFCNLSYYVAGMNRMVSDGIIPCIVDLVLAKDLTTVHYACAALCRLCSNVENAKLILDSGAVPNLVQGTVDGDQITKQFCGSVLSSLSFYEYCRIPLCNFGAISALKGLAITQNDSVTKQRCLVAFANLSCEIHVQRQMINEGVVHIIAELANSYQEINYICCAKAICNLACDDKSKLVVAKEGGVHALMMISMVQSVDRLTKLLCILGLNNLLGEQTVEFMLQEGLINCLTNLCKINDLHIINLCSRIYNHLSKFKSARSKFTEKVTYLSTLYEMINSTAIETQVISLRTCCNLLLDLNIREKVVKAGVLSYLAKGLQLCLSPHHYPEQDKLEMCKQGLFTLFSLCNDTNLLIQLSSNANQIPMILIDLAIQSVNLPVEQILTIAKLLAFLSSDCKARGSLQTPDFVRKLFSLAQQQKSNIAILKLAVVIIRYVVLGMDGAELLDLNILATLNEIHLHYSKEDETPIQSSLELYIPIVETIRILSDSPHCIPKLCSSAILSLLTTVVELVNKQNDFSSTYIQAVMTNIGIILYRFSSHDGATRLESATMDTRKILECLSRSPACSDYVSIAAGMYLMDTRCRSVFICPSIASALAIIAGEYKPQESVIVNVVLAIYAMSKVAASREFLLSPSIQMDRVLIILSGSDSSVVKSNVNRAYKNLHSDLNEAIEEGAVAGLIAMSLEGKNRNMTTNEFNDPELVAINDQIDKRVFDKSHFINNIDLHSLPWYTKVTATKGGAAGKGPEPPEPPIMSTEGSAQYPNLTDELEAGETEGKTKMAFAKMQVPSNVRDAFLLADQDFLIDKEAPEDENPPANVIAPSDSVQMDSVINSGEEVDGGTEVEDRKDNAKPGPKYNRTLSKNASRISSSDDVSVGAVSKSSDVSEDRKSQKSDRARKVSLRETSPQTSPDPSSRRTRKTVKSGNGSTKLSNSSVNMSEQASKLGAASSLTLTPKCSRAKQDTVKGTTVKSSSPGVVKGVKPSHQRKSPHDDRLLEDEVWLNRIIPVEGVNDQQSLHSVRIDPLQHKSMVELIEKQKQQKPSLNEKFLYSSTNRFGNKFPADLESDAKVECLNEGKQEAASLPNKFYNEITDLVNNESDDGGQSARTITAGYMSEGNSAKISPTPLNSAAGLIDHQLMHIMDQLRIDSMTLEQLEKLQTIVAYHQQIKSASSSAKITNSGMSGGFVDPIAVKARKGMKRSKSSGSDGGLSINRLNDSSIRSTNDQKKTSSLRNQFYLQSEDLEVGTITSRHSTSANVNVGVSPNTVVVPRTSSSRGNGAYQTLDKMHGVQTNVLQCLSPSSSSSAAVVVSSPILDQSSSRSSSRCSRNYPVHHPTAAAARSVFPADGSLDQSEVSLDMPFSSSRAISGSKTVGQSSLSASSILPSEPPSSRLVYIEGDSLMSSDIQVPYRNLENESCCSLSSLASKHRHELVVSPHSAFDDCCSVGSHSLSSSRSGKKTAAMSPPSTTLHKVVHNSQKAKGSINTAPAKSHSKRVL